MKKLLLQKIIFEEIDKALSELISLQEQEEPESTDEDTIKQLIDGLAKKNDTDIRKTLIAGLQSGTDKESVLQLIKYASEADKNKVPENIVKIVNELQKQFGIKA